MLLLAVTLYPTALVFWLSLHRTRFYEVVGWAGLNNYVAVLSSGSFWELTFNSLTYVMGSLAIVLPLGVLSALALQSMTRGAGLIRVLLLLPWTLSMEWWAVSGSGSSTRPTGQSPTCCDLIGVTPGLMLGDPSIALLLVILITAWWSFPYAM